MLPNPQETADLIIFTEEIFNGKLHFLCTTSIVIILQESAWNFFWDKEIFLWRQLEK